MTPLQEYHSKKQIAINITICIKLESYNRMFNCTMHQTAYKIRHLLLHIRYKSSVNFNANCYLAAAEASYVTTIKNG